MSIPYNNQRYMPIIPIAEDPKPEDWKFRLDTWHFAEIPVKKPDLTCLLSDAILLNDPTADEMRLRRAWEKRRRKKQRNLRHVENTR